MINNTINNTIFTFTGWSDIVDYESDEISVTLINTKGQKVVEYGFGGFTQRDFNDFKSSRGHLIRKRFGL